MYFFPEAISLLTQWESLQVIFFSFFMNSKKLFLGGVSYKSTEESLRAAFEKAGEVVSVTIIYHRDSGLPRGIAFVEMATEQEAEAAIEMWNGKEVDGRKIVVSEARPDERKPREGGFNNRRDDGNRNSHY
jgi:cold-inducible RNA-binding protein